ncbi:hypothetical protein WICMUC_000081 [Wickerhamomyces mucosus]|uniref:Tubulin gamma chain n=1 Tax=Wickerhamomyces mucosus TaxID=1378264 RepID=A0A9P8PYQ3_9ASCO|nr:hypothetical protein WICMUC_000081 [Wickerhamomyces mucosus]
MWESKGKRQDETNVFFNYNGDNKYTPRALLIDLEPGVISDIKSKTNHLFHDRNIHVSQTGLGAGNIWTKGYDYADNNVEIFLDMLDKELDSCDNLEAFQLIHSVGGGTGSGVGSYLLEILSDRYNKKLTTTWSIFPGNSSDVVIQPYNTILTLKRLCENSDANIVIENSALMKIALNTLQTNSPTIEQTNQFISTIMSSSTNTLRFPKYSYNSLTSIISTLIPTPDLHFIQPSYSQYTSDFVEDVKFFKKSSSLEVLISLLDRSNKFIETNDRYQKYISIFNILQGDYDQLDIQKSIIRTQQRASFVPWSSSSVHIAQGEKSKYYQTLNSNYPNGLMLSNSSSIITLLEKSCKEFDKLFKKRAFAKNYLGKLVENEVVEFEDSRSSVQRIIDEYKNAELISYLDDDDDDEDVDI